MSEMYDANMVCLPPGMAPVPSLSVDRFRMGAAPTFFSTPKLLLTLCSTAMR